MGMATDVKLLLVWVDEKWFITAQFKDHLFKISDSEEYSCNMTDAEKKTQGKIAICISSSTDRYVAARVDSVEEAKRFCEWMARALE
jgi:hypothetical protein